MTWLHHLAGLLLNYNDLRLTVALLASVAVVPAALLAKATAAAEAAEKDTDPEAEDTTDVHEPQGNIGGADRRNSSSCSCRCFFVVFVVVNLADFEVGLITGVTGIVRVVVA